MQHPDEGTIHSWLDGALSAEDAARIASHVAECAQCRTAVAEARGFIAASSRILTALDDVPGGVLPAAAPRKRDLRHVWRAAAAMLVVAGGSLIVIRDRGEDAGAVAFEAVSVPREGTSPSASENAVLDESAGAGADARLAAPPTDGGRLSERRAPAPAPNSAAGSGAANTRDLRRETGAAQSYSAEAAAPRSTGVVQQSVAADAMSKRGIAAGALQPAGPVEPLKIVNVTRTIGSRSTVYEVAPSDTVTLTETESLRLEAVVTTGAATLGASVPGVQRRANTSGARAVAPMSDRAVTGPLPPAGADSAAKADTLARGVTGAVAKTALSSLRAVSPRAAQLNAINWTDRATGKTFTLSGTVPVARLQEIKLRIEQERAAASGKSP